MKLLKELTNFSATKEQIKESIEKNGGVLKLKGVIQRADAENQNGRIYPRRILERELENYMKLVKERRAHGELDHCLRGNSQILTNEGWKLLSEVSDNETIYTLNTKTNQVVLEQIKQKVIVSDYNGKLYRFSNGKNFSMTVSPNHNVLLWDRAHQAYKLKASELAEAIRNKDSKIAHSSIRHNFIYEPSNPKTHFVIPGTNTEIPIDLWAAFFGIWIAEGFVAGSLGGKVHSYTIGLCQKKPTQTQLIQENIIDKTSTLIKWGCYVDNTGKTNWTTHNKNFHSYMSQFGNSHNKFLPEEVFTEWPLSARQELLKWMLIGDGKNRSSKSTGSHIKEYATASTRLAKDVHRLFVTLGYKPFIKVQMPKSIVIRGKVTDVNRCSPVYIVSGNISNTYLDSRFFSVEELEVNENLYCVTVGNGTFMAKDHETQTTFWTGNCDEPVVNLKNISHIITDIEMMPNGDVVGEVEVLDTPMGRIVRALVESQVTVGISSRALGSVTSNGVSDVVGDDLHFICWDFVSEPSTHGAFMFKESKEYDPKILNKIFTREDRINRLANELLAFDEDIRNGSKK